MKFFKLFSNCLPVKGAVRSLIADLQRTRLQFIPNELCDLFLEKNLQKYDSSTPPVVKEYLDFLLEEEYGFLCEESEIEFYPSLNTDFKMPNEAYNAIIDFGNKKLNNEKIVFQLNEINCTWVQLRFFRAVNVLELEQILSLYNSSLKALSIDLIIPFNESFNKDYISQVTTKYINIHRVSIYSSPIAEIIEIQGCNIIYSTTLIDSAQHCGAIATDFFSLNIKAVTEAINYNSCLNGKISIDLDGNIKNCPSMLDSFGNIEHQTLKEVLDAPSFKKYWSITKDQISICKDCEFRYVCTDCRAYVETPTDVYSKPLKCGYSPYTTEWEDWSQNPLKQEAIEYYQMDNTFSKT